MDSSNKPLRFWRVRLGLTNCACGVAGGAAGGTRYGVFTDASESEILGCCLVIKRRYGTHVSAEEGPGSWNAAGLLRVCISAGGSVAVICCNFLCVLLEHGRDLGHVSPCQRLLGPVAAEVMDTLRVILCLCSKRCQLLLFTSWKPNAIFPLVLLPRIPPHGTISMQGSGEGPRRPCRC